MKKLILFILILTLALCGCSQGAAPEKYGTGEAYVEKLDRGICALAADGGVTVSWRFLADDPDGAEFDLYRDGELETLKTTSRCLSCNSTKATPCLSAGIFGDWREELVVRSNDNRSLRIFETNRPTDIRLTTLMQDVQYRAQVAGQNNCYNQPPHPSFYLGSDEPLPARPNVKTVK